MLKCVVCAVFTGCIFGFATFALADAYDAPEGYYDAATGTGATLESQLRSIMSSGHIQRRYGDFRYSAAITDEDPDNPGNILLVYNRDSVDGRWDSGSTWNREHVWPQSQQPGSASNSTRGNLGDPHALRPGDPRINSSRGNKPFGSGNTTGGHRSLGSYYFPGDADKGDIARQLFYSDTRYGLELVNGQPGSNQMGDLASLIDWHYLDAPDDFERGRNHKIFSQSLNPSYYTNNRSAYVDRPELVWSVFVDQQNDSSIRLTGADASADGGSSLDLDLGRVFVGGAGPATASLTVNKTGQDGTYYAVSATGNVTGNLPAQPRAFRNGGTDSAALTVGLDADSSAAGAYSGRVTVDNLDVTTQGGTGRGANDADDRADLTYTVFDHATGSFTANTAVQQRTLDFGEVMFGADGEDAQRVFSIFNLQATEGFTSALSVGTWTAVSGDTSVLSLVDGDTPEPDLVAGGSLMQAATVDTAVAAGNYSATWSLAVGDALQLPGAMAAALVLTLTAQVVPEPAAAWLLLLALGLCVAARRRPPLATPR